MLAQIVTASGGVNLKQRVAFETVVQIYAKPFGKKIPLVLQFIAHSLGIGVDVAAVNYKHARIYALPAQGSHKPVRRYCRPSEHIATVDYQDSHKLYLVRGKCECGGGLAKLYVQLVKQVKCLAAC